jgi:hypothetical protein
MRYLLEDIVACARCWLMELSRQGLMREIGLFKISAGFIPAFSR